MRESPHTVLKIYLNNFNLTVEYPKTCFYIVVLKLSIRITVNSRLSYIQMVLSNGSQVESSKLCVVLISPTILLINKRKAYINLLKIGVFVNNLYVYKAYWRCNLAICEFGQFRVR